MSNELDVQNEWEENTHTHTHSTAAPLTTEHEEGVCTCTTVQYENVQTNDNNVIVYSNFIPIIVGVGKERRTLLGPW